MARAYYNAGSLRAGLAVFEQAYEMSSADFYVAYIEGRKLQVPQFEQHVWASFHEDVLRMERNAAMDQTVMGQVSRRFAACR
jgi:hypothetical protein